VADENSNDIILKNINATKNRIISFEKYMISRSWGLFFVLFSGVIFLTAYSTALLSYVILQDYARITSFFIDSSLLIITLLYWFHIYGETLRFLRLKVNKNIVLKRSIWRKVTLFLISLLIIADLLSSYIPYNYGAIIEMIVQSTIYIIIDFIIIKSVKSSLSEIPGVVYAVVISFLFIIIVPLIVDFTYILSAFYSSIFYYASFSVIVLIWLIAGISMLYSAPDYLVVSNGE
jgi:hypothetical protein